jgi:large subunit ribosomal protein L10e
MVLRPGRCYRRHERPYTRQSTRVPKKGYVKGVPRPKITEFELGTKGDYGNSVFLISQRDVQIRHNALESGRVMAVQTMEKNISKGGTFLFKVRVYPHHVIRENALATGAGADRFQQGMRMSFGKPIGTAARVHAGQKIMEIKVNGQDVNAAKLALKKAGYKMPTPCKIVVA